MLKARFITIEGGEGVGKSAFLASFAAALRQRGVGLEQGREPGGTPSAERIRAFWAKSPADEPWLPMTELCLVSAARAQHLGLRVRPALAAGRWYLCDRYADSSRIYQGVLGRLEPDAVEAIISASTGGLEPDLTFLLDCDVAIAQARITKDRGDATAVERYDRQAFSFHEHLRMAFLSLARTHARRMVVLDASLPVATSVETAMRVIEERFLGGA